MKKERKKKKNSRWAVEQTPWLTIGKYLLQPKLSQKLGFIYSCPPLKKVYLFSQAVGNSSNFVPIAEKHRLKIQSISAFINSYSNDKHRWTKWSKIWIKAGSTYIGHSYNSCPVVIKHVLWTIALYFRCSLHWPTVPIICSLEAC